MAVVSAMAAYQINDGNAGWFVRGTDDPETALRVLLDEYPEAADHVPEPEGTDLELHPMVDRAGWFRFNPCHCGDHGWHLGNASGPGRGRFLGVSLDVGWYEVEFESDEPEYRGVAPEPVSG